MKMFPSFSFLARVMLALITCAALMADAPGAPPPERKPNLLERIGNFFYNVADRLERSDIPDSPGRQSGARKPRPPLRDKQAKGAAAEDASRNRYMAPVNPDPRLLQPPKSSPTKYLDDLSGEGNSGPDHRPKGPTGSLNPVPSPPKPTAPLPDSNASGGRQKPAESSGPAASSQPKKNDDVSGAAKTEKNAHPTAIPTNRIGRVKSPYPPYPELDVTGLPSGSLAKDPVSGKIFRLP
jgi:hypothetical protein